jgi:predicted lipoprotein with Yx(FWY)xxD motif
MSTDPEGWDVRRLTRVLAVTATFAVIFAACGEDPDEIAEEPEEPAAEEPAEDPEETDEEEDAPDADGAEVAVASSDLGEILVDADGMTLYLFDVDEQGEPTCYDDCEAAWPPLTTDGDPVAGDGVDEGLLGTAEREDGEAQVTYDDWPLYYWAGDSSPGDTNGQGVNDVWWVVTADGTPVREGDEDDGASAY